MPQEFDLTAASQMGDLRLLRKHLARNPTVAERSSALISACWKGQIDAARVLLDHGANPNYVSYGETPLFQAARRGNKKIAALLIARGARVRNDMDSLMVASDWCQWDVLELLLKHGARINARDQQGKTPLMWAAGARIEDKWRANAIKVLLTRGATVDVKDKRGFTAIDHARLNGNTDTVQLLRSRSGKKQRLPLKG